MSRHMHEHWEEPETFYEPDRQEDQLSLDKEIVYLSHDINLFLASQSPQILTMSRGTILLLEVRRIGTTLFHPQYHQYVRYLRKTRFDTYLNTRPWDHTIGNTWFETNQLQNIPPFPTGTEICTGFIEENLNRPHPPFKVTNGFTVRFCQEKDWRSLRPTQDYRNLTIITAIPYPH